MRKIISIGIVILFVFISCLNVKAESQPELIKMRATAYCLPGKTCTGMDVRVGLCAAGHREWIGKTCILYQRLPDGEVGEIVGVYEIEDTGCSQNVIDCWMPEDECQDFMDLIYTNNAQGRVWIEVIQADG